jgi:hypothetical protein
MNKTISVHKLSEASGVCRFLWCCVSKYFLALSNSVSFAFIARTAVDGFLAMKQADRVLEAAQDGPQGCVSDTRLPYAIHQYQAQWQAHT